MIHKKKMTNNTSNNNISWDSVRDEILSDPEVKAEYDALQPEFELAGKIITLREKEETNQKENLANVENYNEKIKGNYYEQIGQFGIVQNEGEIKENVKVAGINNEAEQKNLADAAQEIQQLLEQLSQTYPTNTSKEKNIVVGEAVDKIEQNPRLKTKVINALKAGGIEAFQEAINHPLVNILMATIEGWQDEK